MAAPLRSAAGRSIAKQLFARSYFGGHGKHESSLLPADCLILTKAVPGIAVKQQPWLSELSCEGDSAGTILVQPRSVETPPFALEYSQVIAYKPKLLSVEVCHY